MTISQFLLWALAVALLWAIVPAVTWMAAGRRAAWQAAKGYGAFFIALALLGVVGALAGWIFALMS